MSSRGSERVMEIDRVEELIQVLEESDVAEMTIRRGDWGVTIRKGRPSSPPARPLQAGAGSEIPAAVSPPPREDLEITAPMVGIFHLLPEGPREGDPVQPGQVVGVIESMRLMNDVRSSVGGVVAAVLVEDDTPVEYGQPLFRLAPSKEES